MPRPDPLPTRFPIFPLPNVVLFPDVRLPLHVFEPRYRELTRAALAGDRVIGMVLLEPGADASETRAPIFETGCAGRIVEHQAFDDGRFLVVLEGERRFRIDTEERGDRSYRMVQAELLDDPPFDALPEAMRLALTRERAGLEERMLALVSERDPDAARVLSQRMCALDPVQLLHALSFGIDRPPIEKQSLLETSDPLTRAELLTRLFEFRDAESHLSFAPKNVN